MKILLTRIFLLVLTSMALVFPVQVKAASNDPLLQASAPSQNLFRYLHGECPEDPNASGSLSGNITGTAGTTSTTSVGVQNHIPEGFVPDLIGTVNSLIVIPCRTTTGVQAGLLGTTSRIISMTYDSQPSSREYIADIFNNMGLPQTSSAFAQNTGGTGYTALAPFLDFWKIFRNLAYSLYIVIFVVIGIMIMLRTKVNAQTIITIQSAIPNLLITLILITFSYAIVGFLVDLMYFLIYFVVYLVASTGIITNPTGAITRLMTYSAWSVIFEGRNSIITGVSSALGSLLWNLGTGGISILGGLASIITPMYLVVAVAFAIAMLKLMFALIKSYIMVIVMLITAPVQILFNALPGSNAFGNWLKRTASYLIPFPVAAAMFIFAAVLVGDPTQSTLLNNLGDNPSLNANHFFINGGASVYNSGGVWLPPFTLTNAGLQGNDILVLVGFVVFLMTPSAVKMAQEWMQVKESPYTAEAFANFGMGVKGGALLPSWGWKSIQEDLASRRSAKHLSTAIKQPPSLTDRRETQ